MSEFIDIAQEVDILPALQPKPGGQGALQIRDYQVECVDSCYADWQEHHALIAVLPTGMGKTVIAAEVILRWPQDGRILFIAHVQELIYQSQKTIAYHTGENPAIEMGLHRDDTEGHPLLDRTKVLVASIQTMTRRMRQFDPQNFDLIIIDEFHHAAAVTYRKLWDYFSSVNPQIKLLGITATHDRADNLTLACIAQHCTFQMGIRDGIDDGWLVPIEQQYITIDDLDFSKCRTVAKDLNEKDLEAAMMGEKQQEGMSDEEIIEVQKKQERMLHAVAAPAVESAKGQSMLVFCVTVAHAERMAEILRRYSVTAEVVHGKTDYERRKDIIASFKSGKIQCLTSVGCFTEGFDAPNVSVIVMARPTKSRMLYTQMLGRGTRPLPGTVDGLNDPDARKTAISQSAKPKMLVLDFVGNSGKHKLISTADVLAGDMPENYVQDAIDEMKKTGNAEDIRQAAWRKKEEHDKDVKRREEERRARKEELRKLEQAKAEAKRARLKAEAEWHAREIDPFGTADTAPERVQPVYRGGSTDAQIKKLVKLGIQEKTAMTWSKSQAGAVIGKLSAQTGSHYIMTFGKHMGKELREIPASYLHWMSENMEHDRIQVELENYRNEIREGKVIKPQ
ncbi:MAG: DEAD/DEAH box helicase family protein [Patescibacteria group bacterium]|nr:DEAD/DEAH box helicase family protein [Patescibacteria group bacterium]